MSSFMHMLFLFLFVVKDSLFIRTHGVRLLCTYWLIIVPYDCTLRLHLLHYTYEVLSGRVKKPSASKLRTP